LRTQFDDAVDAFESSQELELPIGEQVFYFNPANPTASSMYQQGTGRFDVENAEQPRQVPIRRLDSLLADGLIPQADFIKVDVEGFEKEVLLGARELLSGGVLGLHTETNFGVSPQYSKSHFATLAELALDQHALIGKGIVRLLARE
jgi:hypothetical protein